MKLLSVRQLSEEEIVAQARKNIRTAPRFRAIMLCVAVAMLGLAIWGGSLFFEGVIEGLKNSGGQWHWFYMGVSAGATAVAVFMVLGQLAVYVLFMLIASAYNQRDRLLVRYHNELHSKDV